MIDGIRILEINNIPYVGMFMKIINFCVFNKMVSDRKILWFPSKWGVNHLKRWRNSEVVGKNGSWTISVLDFTHAHLHKRMHFFLCASKFSNLHAHCACNFLVANFKMNRNSKRLLISTNFQGIKSLCFFYFAICVVFTLTLIYLPHFEDVPCQSGVNHIYEG